MSNKTFIVNLKHAAFNRETITIGGGEFKAVDILKEVERMEETIKLGRLLCANLEAEGLGALTIVEHFRNMDESA